jgi:hypothetical protein
MLQPNGEIWRFFKRKRKKKRRNLATRKPKKKINKIIAILEKKEEAKLAKFNKEKKHWVHPNWCCKFAILYYNVPDQITMVVLIPLLILCIEDARRAMQQN